MVLIKWKNGALIWQGVIGNPQFMASFSGALFGSSNFHDMIWQGGAAVQPPCSPASLPSGSPQLPEKESFIPGHLDLCGGNQKQQVMENCTGPVGWLRLRGFWRGSKWTQWVTLSFPVSLAFYSLFFFFFLPRLHPSLPSSTYCLSAFLPESLPPIGNR